MVQADWFVLFVCVRLWRKSGVTAPSSTEIQPTSDMTEHFAYTTFNSTVTTPTAFHTRMTVVVYTSSHASRFRVSYGTGYFASLEDEVYVDVDLSMATTTLSAPGVTGSGATLSASRYDPDVGMTVVDFE